MGAPPSRPQAPSRRAGPASRGGPGKASAAGGGRVRAWLQAARLPSQSYIALPLLIGQALAAARGHPWRPGVLVAVLLFGLFDQLYIVWANDYADQETDLRNRTPTPFSGGSRVLAEGRITPTDLLNAATLAAALALGVSAWLALVEGRWLLVPLALVALALLWAYSFPPLRLSYRGGGELLQAAGTGLVLPLYGYYAQAGTAWGFPWLASVALLPTQLACALSTSMPDEPSDRESGKRTASVRLGLGTTGALVVVFDAAALVAFLLLPWSPRGTPNPVWSLPALMATALCLAWPDARPGTRDLALRVGAAVAATLAIGGAMLGSLLAP
ncbi:MAG TPA: prenyltransferase [Polyangiaceae bacterium]|nr:prenyltransferase [Polyangiaceae bacterium]